MTFWNEYINDRELTLHLQDNPHVAVSMATTSKDFIDSWVAVDPEVLVLVHNGKSVGETLAQIPAWCNKALNKHPELSTLKVLSSKTGNKEPLFSLVNACHETLSDENLMKMWVSKGIRLCHVQVLNKNPNLPEVLMGNPSHFMNSIEFAHSPTPLSNNGQRQLNIELLQDNLDDSVFKHLCSRNSWSVERAVTDRNNYIPKAMRVSNQESELRAVDFQAKMYG